MTISQLPLACPPRYGTVRNPDRPTLGSKVGQVAQLLGKPLMPWQQHVADIATEIDPDTGRLYYRELRLTVPRQSGKSTLVLAKAAHRCSATEFFGPRQRLVYTAQTRQKAREKFKEDYAPDIELARRLRARPGWAPGDEHLRFPNGSKFGIESNTEKAGHGGTLDEAYIDEAFAHTDNRLEQAFGPAMITRRNVQTIVISTAGWADASPYLWGKVEHGRRLIESGEPTRIAYFEWSAPQDADPFDRSVWRACMPALGFTIDEEDVDAELQRMLASEEGLNGFRRAFLNQWVPKGAASWAVPAEWWEACADPQSTIDGKPLLCLSVAPDGATGCLLAAGRRSDGLLHIEVVLHGSPAVVNATSVAEIALRQGAAVALHPGHAAGALRADLEKAKVRVRNITTGDYTRGCGAFYDAVRDGRLRYVAPQPEIAAALRGARRKFVGDAWRWAGDDITALVAASQAVDAVLTAPNGGKGRVIAL
jgi:hypothetical protein